MTELASSPEILDPTAPEPGAPQADQAVPGLALCLSGGGYRAMLFHLGALWRLNQLGYLAKLTRVSSVSGGSITAAALGLRWGELDFDPNGFADGFEREVVGPVRDLARHTVDLPAITLGLLLPGSISAWVTSAYRRRLLGNQTLQALPDDAEGPRFVINATNLQSGVLWRFSKPYMRDYRVGEIKDPEIQLAVAVAASSAFPPFLSPLRLRFSEDAYVPKTGEDLQERPFTTRPVLADGGVYDNLGLQTAWSSEKVLISDGGGAMRASGGGPFSTGKDRLIRSLLRPIEAWRWRDWGTQSFRVLGVIDNQVRALRKRQAIEAFKAERGSPLHRDGTYWGIRSHVADYDLPSSLDCPTELTKRLAGVPTRLKKLDELTQQRLINWGYAISDTALRRWVEPQAPVPDSMPYPAARLG